MCRGEVVNRARCGVAPDATGFDVDELAATEGTHICRPVRTRNRLIETDRGRQSSLQHSVPQQVVRLERLLQHCEIECVQLRQAIGFRGAVRPVGVCGEWYVTTDGGAHRLELGAIPSRSDLHLDATIAGAYCLVRELRQARRRALQAKRDPSRDGTPCPAEQFRQ